MKINQARHLFILLIIAAFGSSCCTILNSERQEVSIHSKPPGATILINDSAYGVTPRTINMKRKVIERKIKLVLPGYEPYEVRTTRNFDGLFFLNILLGGLIGMGIDAATGSMYYIDPDKIDVELKKTPVSQ